MATTKTPNKKELLQQSTSERATTLAILERALVSARFSHRQGTLKNTASLSSMRQAVARLKTFATRPTVS